MTFFQLPVELRLKIYSNLFGNGIAHSSERRQDVGDEIERPSLFPTTQISGPNQGRGAQLLRTCKTILAEARPVLYANTLFRSSYYAFAGRLPSQISGGNTGHPHFKNVEWQLRCDLLKSYDSKDVDISKDDVQGLESVQISCQAETWGNSFCGAYSDREAFVNGRQQVLDFAKLLHLKMSSDTRQFTLVEDRSGLSRARVAFRIFKGRQMIRENDLLIT